MAAASAHPLIHRDMLVHALLRLTSGIAFTQSNRTVLGITNDIFKRCCEAVRVLHDDATTSTARWYLEQRHQTHDVMLHFDGRFAPYHAEGKS